MSFLFLDKNKKLRGRPWSFLFLATRVAAAEEARGRSAGTGITMATVEQAVGTVARKPDKDFEICWVKFVDLWLQNLSPDTISGVPRSKSEGAFSLWRMLWFFRRTAALFHQFARFRPFPYGECYGSFDEQRLFSINSHVSVTFSILFRLREFWNPTNCEKFNADGSLMGRTNLDKSVDGKDKSW